MIHIKKYNESSDIEGERGKEQIDMCFIDFIDNGANSAFFRNATASFVYQIEIEIGTVKRAKNIDVFIDHFNNINDIILNIKTCIEKVCIEYSDVTYTIEIFNSSILINIVPEDW